MEANQFPLFSHLKNELDIEQIDILTPIQMLELTDKIKQLNEQGCSLVYALIRYYHIYEDKCTAIEVPFHMKKIKNGYRFCIEDLPVLLQHLIYRFVEIHLQSQKERSQLLK